jgi:hypothetical protein
MPELLRELGDEQTHFGKLMAAAEDIETEPDGQRDGHYWCKAPASAFPGSEDLAT